MGLADKLSWAGAANKSEKILDTFLSLAYWRGTASFARIINQYGADICKLDRNGAASS